MAGFNFRSLNRSEGKNGVAYRVMSSALEYCGHGRSDLIAYWLGEYATYGDGLVQHGPTYPAGKEYMGDMLASLAHYILNDASNDEKDTVLSHWPRGDRLDRKTILFLAELRPSSNKKLFYRKDELKVSSADRCRHDRRWEEVPVWADGKPGTVLRMIAGHTTETLTRYCYYSHIQRVLREEGQYHGPSPDEYLGLKEGYFVPQAFDALDNALYAHERLYFARRSLECYNKNTQPDTAAVTA